MSKDVHSLLKRINQTGITYQVFSRPEATPAAAESVETAAPIDEAPDVAIEALAAASEPPARSRPALIYARPGHESEGAPRTLFRRYAKPDASRVTASEAESGERLSELFSRYAD
ncbi:hypothetical protein [Phenylobacterium sp.]|uniref:hypothetical protein n=1 Tax=Phenylobacterium sp. TaxID=1871053 RepID=UPI002730C367|nr:hypothetical protein [Phenylobacterium sp.]MDP1617996.1 hypothetical protein [Phenylobacterium sp.]MDP1985651.1 hypothetical protein [Phenylobacterium sp.]